MFTEYLYFSRELHSSSTRARGSLKTKESRTSENQDLIFFQYYTGAKSFAAARGRQRNADENLSLSSSIGKKRKGTVSIKMDIKHLGVR